MFWWSVICIENVELSFYGGFCNIMHFHLNCLKIRKGHWYLLRVTKLVSGTAAVGSDLQIIVGKRGWDSWSLDKPVKVEKNLFWNDFPKLETKDWGLCQLNGWMWKRYEHRKMLIQKSYTNLLFDFETLINI